MRNERGRRKPTQKKKIKMEEVAASGEIPSPGNCPSEEKRDSGAVLLVEEKRGKKEKRRGIHALG